MTNHKWITLFLLYLSLALIRHNGALYLPVIPILLLITGIISLKQATAGALILFIIGASGIFIISSKMKASESRYFVDMATSFANQIRKVPAIQTVKQAALNYFFILNITQKEAKWDLWHTYLNDRYSYDFLKRVGWNDAYPFQNIPISPIGWLHRTALSLYERTYESPLIYLTWNPFYMLGLFLTVIALFWIFPLSAFFSIFIVVQIAALLFISSLNWRYYYFAFFSSYFLIPLMLLDMKNMAKNGKGA